MMPVPRWRVPLTGARYPSYLLLRDDRLEALVIEYGAPLSSARHWIPRAQLVDWLAAAENVHHLAGCRDSVRAAIQWINEKER